METGHAPHRERPEAFVCGLDDVITRSLAAWSIV
jgi:hypothetical protein